MQPMNLYYPSAWLEQAERDLDYSYLTEGTTLQHVGYFEGLRAMDVHAYGWIIGLWFANRFNYSQPPIPVWVYNHPRKPR